MRVGDWIKFDCGDQVREIEGRHVGRVEAILHGHLVKVRWQDTRWISFLEFDELERTTN